MQQSFENIKEIRTLSRKDSKRKQVQHLTYASIQKLSSWICSDQRISTASSSLLVFFAKSTLICYVIYTRLGRSTLGPKDPFNRRNESVGWPDLHKFSRLSELLGRLLPLFVSYIIPILDTNPGDEWRVNCLAIWNRICSFRWKVLNLQWLA